MFALGRLARAAAALALAFGLTGCFDFEQHLILKGSGAGRLEVKLRIDPAFKGAFENQTLLPAQAQPIDVTREIKDGQYVQTEKASFNSLSDLRVENEDLTLINNGTTFFGVGPKKFSLRRAVASGDGAEDMGAAGAAFQDRVYVFSVTIPGWVEKAYPLVVGNEAVKPKTEGATVTWTIPMSQAVAARRLEYRVDFFSYMNVTGTISAQRVEGKPIGMPFASGPKLD
ncbi:MAG: hypothetical protein U1E87_11175 [Alphaproteobacteria bacterium]